jgi:hypothetical protein
MSAATLAIDTPHAEGAGSRIPAPCQILDGRLRPIGDLVADGRPHPVRAGAIVVLITLAGGETQRIPVRLAAGGEYRLHVRGAPGYAPVSTAADPEALETMRLLERGLIGEARALAGRRLPEIQSGRLADPVAIAVVAYALLQVWDREALGLWCLDLADAYPRLSDGAVIAAEWHALRDNHVTALNYLRRLGGDAPLPRFTLGVIRALDRLAGYRSLTLEGPPSRRLRGSEAAAAQLLDREDVKAAGELYDELSRRGDGLSPTGTTTARPPRAPEPAGARARLGALERDVIRRLARATANLSTKEP